jgi:hypothetical protein
MTSVWLSPQYFAPRFDMRKVDPAKGLDPAWFPGLCSLSSAFIWDFAFRPSERRTPEFVRVPFRKRSTPQDISPEDMLIYSWNMTWEIGHLRQQLFKLNFPPGLAWLSKFPASNLYLLPDTNAYEVNFPLYHLLPARFVQSFSLPVFGKGLWPIGLSYSDSWFSNLRSDFAERLSQAFAHYLWPLLNSRSPASAFSQDDPIIVLSHNLDFWLPYAYRLIEDRLRAFPRYDSAGPAWIAALKRLRAAVPPGMESIFLSRAVISGAARPMPGKLPGSWLKPPIVMANCGRLSTLSSLTVSRMIFLTAGLMSGKTLNENSTTSAPNIKLLSSSSMILFLFMVPLAKLKKIFSGPISSLFSIRRSARSSSAFATVRPKPVKSAGFSVMPTPARFLKHSKKSVLKPVNISNPEKRRFVLLDFVNSPRFCSNM